MFQLSAECVFTISVCISLNYQNYFMYSGTYALRFR